MRLTFVVQRYGAEVVGGAETYVRRLAEGLAAEGHDIGVVTSCATSYADWADVYEPGIVEQAGVVVHRVPVRAPRDNHRFTPLHLRAIDVSEPPLWPWAQDRWAQTMGPDLAEVAPVLAAAAASSDVTVFVGYHYAHSLFLTQQAAAFGATAVIPTAHPEGAFHVGRVRQMFEHADRVVCLAPEEAWLVDSIYGCGDRTLVASCPVDPIEAPSAQEVGAAIRARGLRQGRYGVVVGRVDPAKGSDDAERFTTLYRQAVDPDFQLVVVGPGAEHRSVPDGVVATGFVDQATKVALVAGAGVLIQPSYMESFSLSLIEGWLLGLPALVQRRSRVLAGHVDRSGGGLAYGDYYDFEASLSVLLDHPDVARRLGGLGRRYAHDAFSWDTTSADFLSAMSATAEAGARRLGHRRSTSR